MHRFVFQVNANGIVIARIEWHESRGNLPQLRTSHAIAQNTVVVKWPTRLDSSGNLPTEEISGNPGLLRGWASNTNGIHNMKCFGNSTH